MVSSKEAWGSSCSCRIRLSVLICICCCGTLRWWSFSAPVPCSQAWMGPVTTPCSIHLHPFPLPKFIIQCQIFCLKRLSAGFLYQSLSMSWHFRNNPSKSLIEASSPALLSETWHFSPWLRSPCSPVSTQLLPDIINSGCWLIMSPTTVLPFPRATS